MKKHALLLAMAILLCTPGLSLSSYLVELKNGRSFLTSEYWEEDGLIRFYQFGGVIGFKRELVQKIEETSVRYKEEIWEPEPEESTPAPGPEPEGAETATAKDDGTGGASSPAGGDGYVLKEFTRLSEMFRSRLIMDSKQLYDLHQQLRSLVKLITANQLITTYELQYNELYRMIDVVEEIMAKKP